MTPREAKQHFIDFLYEKQRNGEYFKKVHEGQYRMRCPFCGDTQKNMNEGHLYLKIDLDNDYNIAYNCFKCGEFSSYITEELLELIGCDNSLKNELLNMKRTSKKYKKEALIVDFDFKLPDITIMPEKLNYISNRLGKKFTKEEFENMKVITSLYDFLAMNRIKDRPFNNYVLNMIQRDYVGFMTNGNSHILFRDVTNKNKISWIKYPITKDSNLNRVFYTIKQNPIDILTKEEITINLSEGVFDCIGVANHFDYLSDNTMNIAVGGSKYSSMISFLINLGLVGDNITINIFADNDETFNKDKKNRNKVYPTSFQFLHSVLKKYRPLFKKINLYHNVKTKDYGVKKENIILKKESM
jgi:hypothetical protein